MLMTIDELRKFYETNESDEVLEAKLQALENTIHGYTNNNFKRVLEKYSGEYPMDVKLGAVSLLKWESSSRDKAGISSETISRHAVSYVDLTDSNSLMGYPLSLLGFLQPYKRARFGQGVSV